MEVLKNIAVMFTPEWFAQPRTLCGLMSGTSLDGIDAAIVQFRQDNNHHQLQIAGTATTEFPDDVRHVLQELTTNTPVSIKEISTLHTGLSAVYAEAIEQLCAQTRVPISDLDGIGMHGQTVWHQPESVSFGERAIRSTLQLGSGSTLAQRVAIPVVSDFRAADMAQGGHAAPLAPMFDYQFFRSNQEHIIALNLGGIANITIIPASAPETSVIAFDTGPANLLIDAATKKFFGKRYDKGGQIAAAGRVLPRFMETLQQEPYIIQVPPKSTGREVFNTAYLDNALHGNYFDAQPAEDVVRTVTEFTSWSIAENIRRFAFQSGLLAPGIPTTIIASGGGVHNSIIIQRLREELPELTVTTSDERGIPSDGKEAIFFAYLAYRTFGGLHGNLPSVTGASKNVILGSLSFP